MSESQAHDGETPATRRSRDEDGGAKRQPLGPTERSDEGWHERARWTPTAKEFQRYLEREVEMARANLARGNPANSTLHSSATLTRAEEKPKS
jgi:hypothetical protein